MNIAVIGTGFVGVVTSGVLAKFGNQVWGLDIDDKKVTQLNRGKAPFYEPGLEELLAEGLSQKRLAFTTDYETAIQDAEVIFIAVGTPSAKDGTADLSFVKAACTSMAPFLNDGAIVVIKSTVPPGTNSIVKQLIGGITTVNFFVASVPEFLKEGSAVNDTLMADRVVIGASEPRVVETLLTLHKPIGGKRIVISPESAQMAKYTANAYLAQRITFINQIANLCEKNGAQINEVIEAIGADRRIGSHYWYPGLGYGGSCFPKDVKELAAYARSVGEEDSLVVKIDQLNQRRIETKFKQFEAQVDGFNGKTIAVLGLSFKPRTNDMREAPSLYFVPKLEEARARLKLYDPEAMDEARKIWPRLFFAQNIDEACQGAEVILLLIEWPELISLDLQHIATIAAKECVFIDTRNQYAIDAVEAVGMKYIGIGMKQSLK